MTAKPDSATLHDLVGQPDMLLALEPEIFAGVLLEDLIETDRQQRGRLNRRNYMLGFQKHREDVQKAIMEAWIWLEQEGCIAPQPVQDRDWVFVTRRGRQLAQSQDTAAYKRANLLPRQFLHPLIAQKVWSLFVQGEYDTAVFEAFKQVEVAVRKAASMKDTDIGTSLMRKAFHENNGPLSAKIAVSAERQSLSDLFAGAIGTYKNPHSHRNVALTDPITTVEAIILASHLLKIVDTCCGT